MLVENTPAAKAYKGQAWLFLGVANSDYLFVPSSCGGI